MAIFNVNLPRWAPRIVLDSVLWDAAAQSRRQDARIHDFNAAGRVLVALPCRVESDSFLDDCRRGTATLWLESLY